MKKFRIGGVEVVRRVPTSRDSFFGTDLSTGKKLILKRFSLEDEEERMRFLRLCETIGRKPHSGHFVQCEFISEGEVGYVVREYVPGKTLADLSKSKLPLNDVVDFGVQISRQLAAAHSFGITHGNLKASNVVLTPDYKIKVVDFGIKGRPQDVGGDLHSVGALLSDIVDKRRRTPAELKVVLDNIQQRDRKTRIRSAQELQAALQAVGATLKPRPSAIATAAMPMQRFVNTWLQTEGSEQPVIVGQWCNFNMNIGAPRQNEAVRVLPFSEPDWGDKLSLQLLVTFFSHDFEIEKHSLELELPRLGDSPVVSTKVKPLHAGPCQIDVVISLAKELEVLQIVSAEAKVEFAGALASQTA